MTGRTDDLLDQIAALERELEHERGDADAYRRRLIPLRNALRDEPHAPDH
ncbi:MAG TPA: hypothetical protein VKE96_25850 [Vicinamibacterales bacterium]|nr:hypothetical protein [Vicinamibacterales bacterium]